MVSVDEKWGRNFSEFRQLFNQGIKFTLGIVHLVLWHLGVNSDVGVNSGVGVMGGL